MNNGDTNAFVNGDIVNAAEAKISVFDRGFLYGDGVFETVRTYNRKPFLIEEHIARLFRSSSLIKMELPWKSGYLRDAISETLAANDPADDCLIRVTATRGRQRSDIAPGKIIEPTLVVTLRPLKKLSDEDYQNGWKAVISKVVRNSPLSLNPAAKTTNFLNNILAKTEARERGADEAIMLNHRGLVVEGSISNIFIVTGSTIATPPPSDGLLPGITRNFVKGFAGETGIKIEENSISPAELVGADEIFLTVTSAGIMAVTDIDGNMVAGGKEGPTTKRLRLKLTELTSG